jgi:hypothetical protein
MKKELVNQIIDRSLAFSLDWSNLIDQMDWDSLEKCLLSLDDDIDIAPNQYAFKIEDKVFTCKTAFCKTTDDITTRIREAKDGINKYYPSGYETKILIRSFSKLASKVGVGDSWFVVEAPIKMNWVYYPCKLK